MTAADCKSDWVGLQTHNIIHSIPRPHGRTIGCLLSWLWRKLTALSRHRTVFKFIPIKTKQSNQIKAVFIPFEVHCLSQQITSQLRHNEHDGVSNYRRLDCCAAVFSGADQRKPQCSASQALCEGNHQWPIDSSRKGPVTRKMFPFDDVNVRMASKNVTFFLLISAQRTGATGQTGFSGRPGPVGRCKVRKYRPDQNVVDDIFKIIFLNLFLRSLSTYKSAYRHSSYFNDWRPTLVKHTCICVTWSRWDYASGQKH